MSTHYSFLLMAGMVSLAVSVSPWAAWKIWYQTEIKPCLRTCPNQPQAQFICGYDVGRKQYAVALNRCKLKKHNACFDRDFREVPVERCLEFLSAQGQGSTLAPPTIMRFFD